MPVLDLVGAHGTAEDHQPAVTVELGSGVGMAAEVDVAHPEAGFPEKRVQRSQNLEGYVLADE